MLRGKKVLLGVTGGIAAYKSAFDCTFAHQTRGRGKGSDDPRCTRFCNAPSLYRHFPNTLLSSFTAETVVRSCSWNNHVELAFWADLFLIAPATSNTSVVDGARPL